MDRSDIAAFNREADHIRTEVWGVRATLSTDNSGTAHCFPASAPRATREESGQGGGFVELVVRTLMIRPCISVPVRLGVRFTITDDINNPETVGTVWQLREFTGAQPGGARGALCFRLDPPNE